jgi:alpha/beta superfamily hydrolase
LAALAKVKTGNNENIADICETYLPGRLSTVDDDDEDLKQLIKKFSCVDKKAETISQRKIKKAFDFFSQKLEKVSSEVAAKLQKSLEKARIGIFDMGYKCEAYQVFEYQNNRGIHASTR